MYNNIEMPLNGIIPKNGISIFINSYLFYQDKQEFIRKLIVMNFMNLLDNRKIKIIIEENKELRR